VVVVKKRSLLLLVLRQHLNVGQLRLKYYYVAYCSPNLSVLHYRIGSLVVSGRYCNERSLIGRRLVNYVLVTYASLNCFRETNKMSGLWTSAYRYFGGNAFNLEVIGEVYWQSFG
jgi:hypothetical protein